MEDLDLIYLQDENGDELPYQPIRYFHSEGIEYVLLTPQGETPNEENAIILRVDTDEEEETLSPVDATLEEALLSIALANFDMQ